MYHLLTPHRDVTGTASTDGLDYKDILINQAENGWPVTCMVVEDYGVCSEAVNIADQYGVEPNVFYRMGSYETLWNTPGNNYNEDVATAAINMYKRIVTKLPPAFDYRVNLVVYNEVDKNRLDYVADVCYELGKMLKNIGIRAYFMALNSGEPEPDQWNTPSIKRFMKWLIDNADSGYGLAVHEYREKFNNTNMSPWMLGRLVFLQDQLINWGFDPSKLNIAISEFGFAKDASSFPSWGEQIDFLDRLPTIYSQYKFNIKMMAFWIISNNPEWQPSPSGKVMTLFKEIVKRVVPNVVSNPSKPDRIYLLYPFDINQGLPNFEQQARITELATKGISNSILKRNLGTGKSYAGVTGWSHEDLIDFLRKAVVEDGLSGSRLLVLDGQDIGTGLDEQWIKDNHPDIAAQVVFLSTLSDPNNTTEILNVPFVSQLQQDAKLLGDCGTACSSMLIKYWTGKYFSPDYLSNQVGKTTGRYLTIGEVIKSLGLNGVDGSYINAFDFPFIIQEIANQRPFIALVHYPSLPPRVRQSEDNFWHFVVVIGYENNNIIFYDPLRTTSDLSVITYEEFRYATVGDSRNQPYQLILTDLSDVPPAPEPPNFEVKNGIHLNASGGLLSDNEINLANNQKFNTLKVLTSTAPESLRRLNCNHWVIRPFLDFGGRAISPQQFVNDTVSDLKRTLDNTSGEKWVEIHNEPNLVSEGLYRAWNNGAEFANWFVVVSDLYRQVIPDLKILFPGLSPGHNVTNVRIADYIFLNEASSAIHYADGIALHCYWQNPGYALLDSDENKRSGIGYLNYYTRMVTNKPLFVTEYSNNGMIAPANSVAIKANEYKSFLSLCKGFSNIQGIYSFVSDAHPSTFQNENWLSTGIANEYINS